MNRLVFPVFVLLLVVAWRTMENDRTHKLLMEIKTFYRLQLISNDNQFEIICFQIQKRVFELHTFLLFCWPSNQSIEDRSHIFPTEVYVNLFSLFSLGFIWFEFGFVIFKNRHRALVVLMLIIWSLLLTFLVVKLTSSLIGALAWHYCTPLVFVVHMYVWFL